MAVNIRNSKTQEERSVSDETWEKMRIARKNWYAIGSADGAKEAPVRPTAVRAAAKESKPKAEAETAPAVPAEN